VKAYDGLVSRHLNRRVSRPLARALAGTPATPNQLTIVATLIAVGAGLLTGFGFAIVGGILIQVSSIADGIDGDLARAKGMQTRFGGLLDAVCDRYADAAIYAGMTVYAVREQDIQEGALVGLIALSGALLVSYSRARIEASVKTELNDGLLGLASRDVRLLIAAIGTIAGQPFWTLVVLATLTYLTVAWRLWQVRRVLEKPQESL
jgi:phosphatidylglycerophosphate synthase